MGNQCCSTENVTKDAFKARNMRSNSQEEQRNEDQGFDQKSGSRHDVMNRYLCSIVQDVANTEVDNDDEKQRNGKSNNNDEIQISGEKISTTILSNKLADLSSIQAHFLTSDQKYEDQDFLPRIESITSNVNEFPTAKRITWKRITDIIPENEIKVFSGKIEPNDIYQGALGDCYFLSALSTLAEHPNLISRLFETVEYNPSGYYSVWLNHDGIWKQIVIDDYFPCIHNKPAFSKSTENELWVMILEKAYANLFNTYHNIQAGLPEQAVTDLTGSPHDWIFTKSVQETWDYIFSKVEDEKVNPKVKYILNAGSNSDQDGGIEVKDETGIISGHAYAILDAKEVTSRDGLERIIQLRNPWGSSEWQGEWSDKSDKWTPELKELCGFSDKNDGLFWMPIEAFCQKYSNVSCNYLYVDNFYNCQSVDFKQNTFAVVSFRTVTKNTNGYIQFHQKDRRNFRGIDDNYDYSQIRFLIFSGTPTQIGAYVAEVSSFGRSGFAKVNLPLKGDYFVVVQGAWVSQTSRQLVISSYTDKEVYFNQDVEYFSEDQLPYLDDCLLKVPPKKKGEEHVYKEDSQTFRYANSSFGYFYFVYVNQSSSTTFSETLNMSKIEHLEICPPYSNSSQFQVEVKPNAKKVVKYKIMPQGNGGYSYSFKYSNKFSLSKQDLIERILESQSNKRVRKVNGVDTEVYFYSLFNSDGCAFYFDNKTDQTYCEQLKLTLINLQSEDGIDTSKTIHIKLPPQSGKLFKFKEINEQEKSSFKLSYASFFE